LQSQRIALRPYSAGTNTSDGFFMKVNSRGYIRHMLQLSGPKDNAITGWAR